MEAPKNPTNFHQLKGFLAWHGVNFVSIAREHGWCVITVRDVARRYWGQEKRPRAILAMAMILALEEKVRQLQAGTSNEPEAQAS